MRMLFCAAFALAACTQPRKLVLEIDTNAGVPCDIDKVAVRATAAGTTMFETTLEAAHLPAFVTLLDGTPSGSFMLELTGLKGSAPVMKVAGELHFSGSETSQPVMLDLNCPVDGSSCGLSGAMAAGSAAAAGITRFQCGPNVQSYAAAPTGEGFVDACSVPGKLTGSVLMDGTSGPVELDKLEPFLPGFNFQLFGQPIHKIWVSRDGYISFQRTNPDPGHVLVPGPFDTGLKGIGAAPPGQSVMAFWDSITLGATGVCWEIEGNSPGQLIRVTWSHACLTTPCGSGNLNATITLDESLRRIVLSYMITATGDRERGQNATVGLVNDATGCTTDQCVLDTGLCMGTNKPCGYSQVFSKVLQTGGLRNFQFTPTGTAN
jgi:hypothetical protein